jgi:dolichol-phosphate mannosyltransferase
MTDTSDTAPHTALESGMSDAVQGPELSVIVPTFNERENVQELIRRLGNVLKRCRWEVIFVDDDSPDETARLVREIAQRDNRVRCVQRVGRRGLSTACVEGMLASSAPYLAVIDGDMQHDEALLPDMLQLLQRGESDIVIGTRYAPGGGVGDWDDSRVAISSFAGRLSRLVLKSKLSDPMSGFFMLRREWMESAVRRLSGIGFKILLDLFASAPRPPRFAEVPYEFRARKLGESKLDTHVAWEYIMLLMDKLVGHIVPVRLFSFGLVGGVGVIVHFTVLGSLFNLFGVPFDVSQGAATLVAMTSNFALNNILTYRDMRLKGWRWLRGWVSFVLACGVGALANVGIASYLFEMDTQWILAGLAGILVGTVWNYVVTMLYTWKAPGRRI